MSNTLGMAEVKAFTHRVSANAETTTYAKPAARRHPGGRGFFPTRHVQPELVHACGVGGREGHETGFTTVFAPNTRVTYSSGGTDYDVDLVLGRVERR